MDELTEQIERVILACEMEPGQVYITAQSSNELKVRLKEKKDGVVWVEAYWPTHGKWMVTKVTENYRVRIPRTGEIKMAEQKEASTATTEKKGGKNKGQVSGLTMLRAWGHYFEKLGHEEGGRQLIIDAMLADFPHKVESVNRWVDAYRIYYNTGRLPDVEKPTQPVVWPTAARAAKEAEKIAKAEAKAAAKASKAAEKEAAKAQKAQERAEKRAKAEAARAEAATNPQQ